ncbi:hypothetical protein M514_04232 [Trichuris suis]|uniref:BPTI/Kunitz inhibitor domain-containing protein n=1 Tax=Trichuris suis TaxID=68888 RepID=A0A085NQC8_9BILA|nr:hypothetical protein M513_04232 [Trichuris suis]KFD71674.1 hypothetical protein M514_04232 [Trichuris suis]KHJ45924.1 hypothetical protein D918_03570 [Trichuris suis]
MYSSASRHIVTGLTLLLAFHLVDEASSQKATSGTQYTCRRQLYKEVCATGLKSQFVWRWYLEDGECRTYPYGYCVGEDDVGVDQALRYQEDCETYCIRKEKVVAKNREHTKTARSQFEEFSKRARNRSSPRVRSDRDNYAPEQPSLGGYGGYAGPSAGPSPPGHFSFEHPANGGRGSDSGTRVEVLGPEIPPQAAHPEEGRGRPTSAFESRGPGSRLPQGPKGKSVTYSCERLPYREKCATGLATQFTLRWHLYNGECISYPYGYCNGIDSIETDPSIRYKEDCETICIRGQKLNIRPGQREFGHHHHHDHSRRRYT